MKMLFGNEKGMILPLTALLIPVYIGLMGLLVDIGFMGANYFKLANGVDSAVYAALDGYDRDTWQNEGVIVIDSYKAQQLANQYLHANVTGATVTRFEISNSSVIMEARMTSPVFFMRFFGISDRTITASAEASLVE
ncbi:TadE/TadG family type IV pilus assembly protein [Halalkalibacter krulwichiae]|uniref:Uncharacterized protein n=1 Tax=Halalkalibacter krulwichiae TaxID=199441 RepID=A0A1X9MK10_9BACI|nr:pilus assembly protein TadG-related protein [Halalkalibacter krulwichiae]ARK31991.1 hypothetical protein BkAM31D_20270 [Halalkalibacter krulwichiae]